MHAGRQQVDIVQRLLARVPGLVADLEAPQPFHARHALHAGHQQPQRIAVFGPQHLAVLAVDHQHVVERELDRDRAREARAVGAFGQHEARAAVVEANALEQRRQAHAGKLATRQHAVGVLHRWHRDIGPFHAGVGAAFDEVDARHRRQPHQVVDREHHGLAHQPVDHEPMAARIDVVPAGMMAFEVHAGRGDDAEQALQRREGDGRDRRAREPGALAPSHGRFELRRQAVAARGNRRAQRARVHRQLEDGGIVVGAHAARRDRGTGDHGAAQEIAPLESHGIEVILRRGPAPAGHSRCRLHRLLVADPAKFTSRPGVTRRRQPNRLPIRRPSAISRSSAQ